MSPLRLSEGFNNHAAGFRQVAQPKFQGQPGLYRPVLGFFSEFPDTFVRENPLTIFYGQGILFAIWHLPAEGELCDRPPAERMDYFARLRVVTSKITATANTAPRTMYCKDISMVIKFIPLVSEVMTNAPMIEPIILPTPPAAETPPT